MIKYEKEYKETLNKEEFIKLAVVIRKLTTEKNAKKRYSELKKKFGEQKKYNKRKVVISTKVKKPVKFNTIKYEQEYKETSDKNEFVQLCVMRKLTTEKNAKKRYSELKKKFGEQKLVLKKLKNVQLNKKQVLLRAKRTNTKVIDTNFLKQIQQKETPVAFKVDEEGFMFVDLTNNNKLKGVRIMFERTEGRKSRTVGLEIKK